jgi:hypothetical protein
MSNRPKVTIRYINTDLDLTSARDLRPLANALEANGVRPLYPIKQSADGLWYSVLEIEDYLEEPEPTICIMLEAIEKLDGEARSVWDECTRRDFNIGYDCGDEPWAFNNGISNAVVLRIAESGASLRITLYPPAQEQ